MHVAGTNGKGAVCAILDSCLRAAGIRSGRNTSPHLVRLNERFFVDGAPASDELIEASARKVAKVAPADLTFFEALTATAFDLYAGVKPMSFSRQVSADASTPQTSASPKSP